MIISTFHLLIGLGFWRLADYSLSRITWPAGRVMAAWPCYGIAAVFIASAFFNMLMLTLGIPILSIIVWFWHLFGS